MLEAHHVTASGGKKKAKYALPPDAYTGKVNEGALYHSVRAYLSNQRQGTHSTKTRAEVAGGRSKPWRQKGTGRARQGTTRAAQWRGGGVVFGPRPRSYRIDLPRKVKRVAKRSALNARANEGALYVIESLEFDAPKTRQMVELLQKLELSDKKVLILTADNRREIVLSARNLERVYVERYANAAAYEILWADVLVVEEAALAAVAEEEAPQAGARVKRAQRAAELLDRKSTATKAADDA